MGDFAYMSGSIWLYEWQQIYMPSFLKGSSILHIYHPQLTQTLPWVEGSKMTFHYYSQGQTVLIQMVKQLRVLTFHHDYIVSKTVSNYY